MSLIENAIDSIQIGVEDFSTDNERRYVSAVRNLTAGILLLYKHKLCELSPEYDKELLIKQEIRPVINSKGAIVFNGHGKKTVDVQQIKERFKSLGIKVDWERFDEINILRNDLEHYFTKKTSEGVREIIAKSFLLIRNFLSECLSLDPKKTLGDECWSKLLAVNEVYSAEEKDCKDSRAVLDWKYLSVEASLKYLRCTQCHSSLIQAPCPEDIYPYISLSCKSCGHKFNFVDVVEECIDASLAGEAHVSLMEGGDSLYEICYECEKSTFIFEEGCCVACGYEMQYTSCLRCGDSLTLDDQYNEGLCSYCQYQWEKTKDS